MAWKSLPNNNFHAVGEKSNGFLVFFSFFPALSGGGKEERTLCVPAFPGSGFAAVVSSLSRAHFSFAACRVCQDIKKGLLQNGEVLQQSLSQSRLCLTCASGAERTTAVERYSKSFCLVPGRRRALLQWRTCPPCASGCRALPQSRRSPHHSHSMVPGGLDVMS